MSALDQVIQLLDDGIDMLQGVALRLGELPRAQFPACNASREGKFYFSRALTGAGSGVWVCRANNAGTYAWRDLADETLLPAAGVIEAFGGLTIPDGYLLCDGSAVSRTGYARLFAALGTLWGSGNGTTTFNLPNLQGRVVVGQDSTQVEFDTVGETGGAKVVTLTSGQSGLPAHVHAISLTTGGNSVNHTHVEQYPLRSGSILSGNGNRADITSANTSTGSNSAGHTHNVSGDSASVSAEDAGSAHQNMPPYVVMKVIIKT